MGPVSGGICGAAEEEAAESGGAYTISCKWVYEMGGGPPCGPFTGYQSPTSICSQQKRRQRQKQGESLRSLTGGVQESALAKLVNLLAN
jgi:hypothetical protein